MADFSLQGMWDTARQNPSFNSLADMVKERMPNFSVREGRLDNAIGQTTTSFGSDPQVVIDRQQIINTRDPQSNMNNVLHHELIHALDNDLALQARFSKGGTPEEQRFSDAYSKLDPRALLETMADSLAKINRQNPSLKRANREADAFNMLADEDRRGNKYRGSSGELRAFGTANSIHPKGADWPSYGYRGDLETIRGVQHLDPSIATETAILQDLAERARKAAEAKSNEPSWMSKHIDAIKNLFSK